MSKSIVRLSILIASLVFTYGCPRPVGGCMYGNAGGESWLGTVTSMQVLDGASGKIHVIVVEGDSTQEFRLHESDYNSCIAHHDIEVGSEVHVEMKYGGPCPPMRRIMECPFGG